MPGTIVSDEIELIIEKKGGGGGELRLPQEETGEAATTGRSGRTGGFRPGATTRESRSPLFRY